jgi:heat shock protein HslJ
MGHTRVNVGIIFGLSLMLVALPAGCGTSTLSGDQASLDGSEWILAKLMGDDLVPGTQITLGFEEGRAGGFAGCNAYGGAYLAGAGALSVSALEMTAQACVEPQGVMEQEAAYLAALQQAAAYRMTGNQLEIEDDAGGLLLALARKERADMDPADLLRTEWQLVSLNGASPVEGSSITLAFLDDSHATGMAGCRELAATYEASGDEIHFLSQTMGGDDSCLADEALYRQEGQYTDALTWATNYRLGEDRLEIDTARGELLVFELLP